VAYPDKEGQSLLSIHPKGVCQPFPLAAAGGLCYLGMLLYLVLGALSTIVSFIFGALLPCGVATDTCTDPFLPLPSEISTAFLKVGQGLHFFLYYFGDPIGDAAVAGIELTLSIGLVIMVWRVIANFRAPIVQRLTHGPVQRDI